MSGVRVDQYILEVLVKRYFRKVSNHLDSIEVDLGLLTYHWFLSVLVDQIPLKMLLKTWDMILLLGSQAIFDPILMAFHKMEETIEQYRTTKDVKEHFNHALGSIDSNDFQKALILFHNAHPYIQETRRIYPVPSSPRFFAKQNRKTVQQSKNHGRDIQQAVQKSKANRYQKIMQLNLSIEKMDKSISTSEMKLKSLHAKRSNLEAKLQGLIVKNQNISVLEQS
eukprot:g2376.t1